MTDPKESLPPAPPIPSGVPPSRSAPPAPSAPTSLKEYALLVPRLARLVWRLSRDPRVPARTKATMFLVAGYLLSPVDVIPDFVPGIGHVDDVVILAFALDQMLNRIPEDVVLEHWDGDEDVLEVVRQVLDISTAYVPGWLKKRFSPR